MKRYGFLSLVLALLFLASGVLSAAPGLALLEEGRQKGVVTAVTSKGVTFVAFDEMASQLGMKGTLGGEDYQGEGQGHKIRLIHNSTAVWLDYGIVALPRAAQVAQGHLWLDKESALKVAEAWAAAQGKKSRFSWGGVASQGAAAPAPQAPPAPAGEKKLLSPAPKGKLGAVTALRFGDNGDFYRLVVDLSEEGDVPFQLQGGQGMISADTASAGPVPDLGGAGRLTLSPGKIELAARGVLKSFWLKEPRRLVLDWPKDGALALTPETPQPFKTPAASPAPVEPPKVKPAPSVPASAPLPEKEPTFTTVKPRGKKPFVMIDPGHGGKDTGATRGSYQEKVIALQIAKKLQKALTRYGIDSRLTREGDTYPTLTERPAMANALKADAFVSIHLNSLATKSGKASGQEIYIMALPTDKDAEKLAKLENAEINAAGHRLPDAGHTDMLMTILGNMRQNAKITDSTAMAEDMYNQGEAMGVKMRRVAQAPFAVLRGAAMPAVLVETGFITHPEEVKLLASAAYQTKLAEAMAKGLSQYLKKTLNY